MALLSAVIQRGSRASQPLATAVGAGTLYCVTDEGDIIERSSGSAWEAYSPSASTGGTVTHTGTLTSGQLIKGNGGVDIAVTDLTGDVTTSGGMATTIANSAVTLAKIANAAASSKLVGSGATGSGSPYAELTLGTNLSMSGTTLNATGGGSGNAIGSTAVGSEPGGPATGDLDLYTNGFDIVRYSGAAWVPWGPMFAFTDPNLAGLSTWVNQGSATVSTTNGGIYLRAPSGSGDNFKLRVKTAPGTPYVITAAFLPMVQNGAIGLAFRESGSGKLQFFMYGAPVSGSVTGVQLFVITFTNPTSFNGTNKTYDWAPSYGNIFWMRIADDGTNRLFSVSGDGQNWEQFYSTPRTTFLTADQVGIFVNGTNAEFGTAITLLSWKET